MHDERNMPDHLHSGTENDNQMQVEVFVLQAMWVSRNITHFPANLL
jgi:hypothetical protein